ncbi:MAG: xanthine dehydrogenase family protein molybdopterin-binding subunit [Reyranella sp.]|uniref:xanthine dehydrogenase family protein molybdopterin-binding subunit n=1 Tax=Reyranella sp. TaxID=1929291 RepID=UPI003D0C9167
MVGGETSRFVGRSMLRREDLRLLTGQGQFVADLAIPGTLHAVFVRSPVAHGHIRSIEVAAAAAMPGVVHVLNGADLHRLAPPVAGAQLSLPGKWRTQVQYKFHVPQQPMLAVDKVRHVGEAVAVVLAETRDQAQDAAERVAVDIEPLAAMVDPAAALAPDAAIIHEAFATNLIGEFAIEKGQVAAALSAAPFTLRRRFYTHRYAGIPLECRGVIAAYDKRTSAVTIWSATQVVHSVRREAAAVLGLPEARVRCVALDVGGGFGTKGHVYPEELLIPLLARLAGRPVRWIEERQEHLLCSCHSRDQVHEVEVGFDRDGRVVSFRDAFMVDCGAWNPIGAAIAYNTAVHLLGPYRIANFAAAARIVATNKVPNAPYRGAGRPEAAFAMERTMDLIARTLDLEPTEVRRRNMIRPEEMPYAMGLPYRDGEPIVYDSGDFPGGLDKALQAMGGLPAFRERQRKARAAGRHLGLGVASYVEGTGVGPFESATVRIESTGSIFVTSGACSQGQGMETIFTQVVADAWSVDPQDVVIALGDTSLIAIGGGTIASRSTVNLSGAIHHASERLRAKVFAIAANLMECAPADLELRAGKVGVVGAPGMEVTLASVAKAAAPGWDHRRPEGMDAGLEETFYWQPPTVTWANATHLALVEVDIASGRIDIEQYVVAHDCGVVINPMLVDGQVVGGTIQGIGGTLFEEFVYDREGQLLTGSLMDYALPRASDSPAIRLLHQTSPSPLNPLGVKGVGEGGAIAPPAAIANAVCDALSMYRAEFNATPIKPEQVVRAVLTGRKDQ